MSTVFISILVSLIVIHEGSIYMAVRGGSRSADVELCLVSYGIYYLTRENFLNKFTFTVHMNTVHNVLRSLQICKVSNIIVFKYGILVVLCS
jgi:hypothetical protein